MISEIHQLKRDLLLLRWVIWPVREVVSSLLRLAQMYHRDLRGFIYTTYDHVIQIIEIIEAYREITSDLTDTYMSSASNRMGEVMKVLTLIGTIFIPLTFLAGVYGMNFHFLPELKSCVGIPGFLAGMCRHRDRDAGVFPSSKMVLKTIIT